MADDAIGGETQIPDKADPETLDVGVSVFYSY